MKNCFLTSIFLFGLVWRTASAVPCNEDYFPCSCVSSSDPVSLFKISCNDPGTTLTDVADVFQRISVPSIKYLEMTLRSPSDDFIPANLLSDKIIEFTITVTCAFPEGVQLQVDPEAFSASRAELFEFDLVNCDSTRLNYTFLTGFTRFDTVSLSGVGGLGHSMPTLPILNRWTYLYLTSCSGFQDWLEFPLVPRGFDWIEIIDSQDADDESMSRVLDWIVTTSKNAVSTLKLRNNHLLTKIPDPIRSLNYIFTLEISGGNIPIFSNDAFYFDYYVSSLTLSNNNVSIIEPDGALQGNFYQASVDLDGNLLTRFEEGVFLVMLKQIASRSPFPIGYVDIGGSPIDCESDPCHLKWLIVDNSRLLPYVRRAVCSNGTPFSSLSLELFDSC